MRPETRWEHKHLANQNLPYSYKSRDHFVNASSQWETTLQCNVVLHWLCAYTKRSQRRLAWSIDADMSSCSTRPRNIHTNHAFSWLMWFCIRRFKFYPYSSGMVILAPVTEPFTHWGRVTNICVSKLTILCSDNGLSPGLAGDKSGRRQAIIWTNAGILLIGTVGTNFSKIFKVQAIP